MQLPVLLNDLSIHTESYLLWRFWQEGWICNKTAQKLQGTNTVIGISSGLISVKL